MRNNKAFYTGPITENTAYEDVRNSESYYRSMHMTFALYRMIVQDDLSQMMSPAIQARFEKIGVRAGQTADMIRRYYANKGNT